jgi:hypothetical protein
VVERCLHTAEVGGSRPSSPTHKSAGQRGVRTLKSGNGSHRLVEGGSQAREPAPRHPASPVAGFPWAGSGAKLASHGGVPLASSPDLAASARPAVHGDGAWILPVSRGNAARWIGSYCLRVRHWGAMPLPPTAGISGRASGLPRCRRRGAEQQSLRVPCLACSNETRRPRRSPTHRRLAGLLSIPWRCPKTVQARRHCSTTGLRRLAKPPSPRRSRKPGDGLTRGRSRALTILLPCWRL